MKLATIDDGTPDGQLVLVSRDHLRACPVGDIAATLQQAIEGWASFEPALLSRAEALEAGTADGIIDFEAVRSLAPLPRAWQWLDGSVYATHGDLLQKGMGLPPNPMGRPLMYQGISDTILPPTADASFVSEDDGIDFEGEFGVIVDQVPIGTTTEDAAAHIRLLVQINDWSLRVIGKIEMQTGFAGSRPSRRSPWPRSPSRRTNWVTPGATDRSIWR